jgi:hypothetical protein
MYMVKRCYGLGGWSILRIYGSIDNLWPKGLNQESHFMQGGFEVQISYIFSYIDI